MSKSWLEQMDKPVVQVAPVAKVRKPMSLGELRRMNRNLKSWPKAEANVKAVNAMVDSLGFFQREAAFSHFLGGCTVMLQTHGAVSRKEFCRLMLAAYEFGKVARI